MHQSKYLWAARAIMYKLPFGHIGNLTYMGKPCFIEGMKNIYIGNCVRIFPGIRMEAIGTGQINIGNNVAIEQNVHITSYNGILDIGDNVTIAANTFITNLDHEYNDINKGVMDQGLIPGETHIGEGCFIVYGVAVQAGTVLGRHCIVGAGAVVRGIYPAYSVVAGVPARIIKQYNTKTKKWERV